jgi:dihydroxyacetone kinase
MDQKGVDHDMSMGSQIQKRNSGALGLCIVKNYENSMALPQIQKRNSGALGLCIVKNYENSMALQRL